MIVKNVAFATITLTAINNVLSEIANTMYCQRQGRNACVFMLLVRYTDQHLTFAPKLVL